MSFAIIRVMCLLAAANLIACAGGSSKGGSTAAGGQGGNPAEDAAVATAGAAAGDPAGPGPTGGGGIGGTGGRTSAVKGGSGGGPVPDAGPVDLAADSRLPGTCEGTPSVTCASTDCASIAGCVATTPSCAGTAQTCNTFNGKADLCAKQVGCLASLGGGICHTVGSCDDYDLDRITCAQVPGCTYNLSTFSCAGTAASCEGRTSQSSCSAQVNCGWEPQASVPCVGTPSVCSSLKGASCTAQSGCYTVAAVCTGQPTACSALPVESCARQPGCRVAIPGPTDGGTRDGGTCVPGQLTCASMGQMVERCADDGLSRSVVTDCAASGQTCLAGACSTNHICTPNWPACQGNLAVTCNADGSGYLAGGTDCYASSKICYQGTCQSLSCVPNARYCEAGNVRTCASTGLSSSLTTTCLATQFCDATSATCKTRLCDAGKPVCDKTVATTCNADGSGYLAGGTDCSGSNQVCDLGVCKARLCTPDARFCEAGNVRQCSSNGLTSTLLQTCQANQTCNPTAAACAASVCTASQPTCNGNVATTCNSDGSAYLPGGTDCTPTGQLCYQGTCQNLVCVPLSSTCKDGAVLSCDSTGQKLSTKTCLTSEFCDAGTATCKPRICIADQPVCNGDVATTCNASGSGYLDGGTDCAAQSKTCTLAGCSVFAVDEAEGLSKQSARNDASTLVNYYSVTVPRTLSKIEVFLSARQGQEIIFMVYEAATKTSLSYAQILSLATTVKTSDSAGNGTLYSSGLISVPLRAGYYYAIGVFLSLAPNAYWVNSNATLPRTNSFGALESSANRVIYGGPIYPSPLSTIEWTAPANLVHRQRLTTTP